MIYVTFDDTGKVIFPAYGNLSLIPEGARYITVDECDWNAGHGKILTVENGHLVVSEPPPTLADYDAAMEAHLKAEREARGYTLREPSDYAGSSVERWAQDAADWIAHRDAVMLYALDVLNHVEAGDPAPTLDEFKNALPVIEWSAE